MPSRTLPNLGLKAFYDFGEDGWNEEQDLNILKLSVLVQGGVASRLIADPASPLQGDVHIIDTQVCVYDDGAWVRFTPQEGWLLFDRAADVFVVFNGATWVVLETGGGGGGGNALPTLVAASGSHTVLMSDGSYQYITVTSSSPVVVTIPANSDQGFPVGTQIVVEQAGTGSLTVENAAGVTVNSRGSVLTAAGQYAVLGLTKKAENTWTLTGDLDAS